MTETRVSLLPDKGMCPEMHIDKGMAATLQLLAQVRPSAIPKVQMSSATLVTDTDRKTIFRVVFLPP